MKHGTSLVGLLGLTLIATACGDSSETKATTPTVSNKVIKRDKVEDSKFKPVELETTIENLVEAIGKTEAVSLQLDVNLKSLNGFWDPVVVGANRAMGELDVAGSVTSPQVESGDLAVQQQTQMLKEARESGSNGLGTAPFEAPVAEQIDAAVDSGIPVVTIDSDLSESKRDLYIGTMNAEAGVTGGNTLLGYLTAGAGTVIILGHDDPGWPAGYDRSMGAKGVLEAAGYTVIVRRTDWSETGEAADLKFLGEAIAAADPPVVGMIGMFSDAYRCAMAAEAAKLTADDVSIVAFDFDPKTVTYMQSGMIRATHAQRQYYEGYLTPYVLYGINVLGKKETLSILKSQLVGKDMFNAGLDVVKNDELDEYYSFLDSLGVGG
jgi:ribose transport system substrate-binding protein